MQVDLGTFVRVIRAWGEWNPGAVVITPGDIHRCKPVTDDFKLLDAWEHSLRYDIRSAGRYIARHHPAGQDRRAWMMLLESRAKLVAQIISKREYLKRQLALDLEISARITGYEVAASDPGQDLLF